MPPEPIFFEHKDLLAVLLRDKGISSGHWLLAVQFALGAGYVVGGEDQKRLPAAIVPVLKIGIQSSDKPSDITVDAAEVGAKADPTPKGRAGRKKASRT